MPRPLIFHDMRRSAFTRLFPAALLFAGVTAFSPASRDASSRFHAHLVRADPAVNDTIAATPKTVRLWFSEPVELALSRVKIERVGGDTDRKSRRLNSSHSLTSRMPSSA